MKMYIYVIVFCKKNIYVKKNKKIQYNDERNSTKQHILFLKINT